MEIAFLIMDDEIKAMKGYKIKETKGYGTRAFEENYLNQFIGINLKGKEQLRGGSKPSQDIDIIYVTGATRTSKAVVIAFNILIEYYCYQHIDVGYIDSMMIFVIESFLEKL